MILSLVLLLVTVAIFAVQLILLQKQVEHLQSLMHQLTDVTEDIYIMVTGFLESKYPEFREYEREFEQNKDNKSRP